MEMNLCFGLQEKWHNNRKCVVGPSRFLVRPLRFFTINTGLWSHEFMSGHLAKESTDEREMLWVLCTLQ
jgi:hypothetical protein